LKNQKRERERERGRERGREGERGGGGMRHTQRERENIAIKI